MTQRTILITGCSSGIGLASARMLRDRGWRVIATARKAADLRRLETEERLEAVPLELADPASIAACAAETLRRTDGQLMALFNNAAYGQVGAVEDLTADVLRKQMEVNFIGTHALTRAVIPVMRAQGYGRIVNCSSVLGLVTGPYRGAYSASKFALEGLTDAMRLELRGTGIFVSLVEPGPIRTRFLESAIELFKRNIDMASSPHRVTYAGRLKSMESGGKTTFKMEPEAVARKVVHAVESPRPKIRYFVTVPTYVAAVAKRVLPDRLADVVIAKL
jgi:NAD(P)-dependent dehydrogenase (short-subunit alcohol dehydrogenase family)